ncbi:hypothetical protein NOVOSPHI9U_210003 [Novosphingobium sp. 9U]|nr:hypothetical protein NOVOSPHI9U_210003 [Novosphingobium sp. 9U]
MPKPTARRRFKLLQVVKTLNLIWKHALRGHVYVLATKLTAPVPMAGAAADRHLSGLAFGVADGDDASTGRPSAHP